MSAPAVAHLRGPLPATPAAEAAPVATARRPRAPGPDDGLLMPTAARVLAWVAFAGFGGLHWMQMLDPAAPGRAWSAIGGGLLVIVALLWARRLARGARWVALTAVVATGGALALLAAGAPGDLLRPGRWDELAAGVARGMEALAGARVPYRGIDEWLALVIPLGGTLLIVGSAALAFWPRRGGLGSPAAALVALVALYAIPAVSLIFEQEFLRGALLALLVIAFLRLERIRRRDSAAAAVAGALAITAGLAVAPAIDGLDPWWDYETWALSAGESRSTTFSWDHEYGPLDWPRDGRELLRVRARTRAYWKADHLDYFDGRRWTRAELGSPQDSTGAFTDGVDPELLERWTIRMRVSVRNLRTETFVTAGTVVNGQIRMPGRGAVATGRPGTFATSRTLRRGDAYSAEVYVPQPDRRLLQQAGTAYGGALEAFTRIRTDWRGVSKVLEVPAFRAPPVAVFSESSFAPTVPVDQLLAESPLRRTWRLARRLAAGASTPYDYVQRIERHLGRDYRYSETPPPSAATLEGFLFDAKIGYCQQFSGAMALLLRLGGVPARVATGFAPGSYDEGTKEYIVRDFDAHSWVEAWFPGIGWVPFDPTPTSAPPRSQAIDALGIIASVGDVRDLGTRLGDARRSTADDGGPPWALVGGSLLLLTLVALGARRAGRRARRRAGVLELERALRIAGGGLAPPTTLSALEERFAGSPAALGYLRALRAQRYAAGATAPTPEQRRGLRRALARGGPAARARAWWALPPAPFRRHR